MSSMIMIANSGLGLVLRRDHFLVLVLIEFVFVCSKLGGGSVAIRFSSGLALWSVLLIRIGKQNVEILDV